MAYQQIRYRTAREFSERIVTALETCGAAAVTIESAGQHAHFDSANPMDPDWPEVIVSGLFPREVDPLVVQAEVERSCDRAGTPQIEWLADRDWETAWLDQYRPIQISAGLWVCPSWLAPPDPGAVNVIIDPGLAFGTGTHPTTALCLEWLATAPLKDRHVLDYGCGSGILAIAALKLGAAGAMAVDVDERALATARANAASNEVADRIEVLDPAAIPRGYTANIVLVNILADVIIELAPDLSRLTAADGTIILTGVLTTQLNSVQRAFSDSFKLHTIRRDEWCLIIGRRPMT